MSTIDEAVAEIKNAKDAIDGIVANQNPGTNKTKYPDAKKHKYVSFLKSAIRIVACGFLAYYEVQTAAILFALAEVLGIAEELV